MPRGTIAGCKCPTCNGRTAVVDSREGDDNTVVRRRRCLTCGLRFNTVEQFSGWQATTDSGKPRGRRSKHSPDALVLEEAREAAKSVPTGRQTFMGAWWDFGDAGND